ncbi:hypothetical protein BKI52_34440 [marine bacterium AO1-C]|nr:hypothetical protein BKI52_34440 [marine bacterium AO1-C]
MKKNKSNYNILVLEDEIPTQTVIMNMVKDLGYSLAGAARSYKEAMAVADDVFPDVALCDINILGYRDGIMVARALSEMASERNADLAIVYITVYDDEDIVEEAITTQPAAYLLKSQVTDDRSLDVQIRLAIQGLENRKNQSKAILDGKIYSIWSRGKCYHIELDTILYIKASNNECILFTEQEIIDINQPFGEIVSQLEPLGIQQVHRSYAVNMKKVKSHEKGPTFIQLNYRNLSNGLISEVEQEINVSGSFRSILRSKFGME